MAFFKTPQFIALFRQTWPMIIGLFTIMASQLIDSAFIGQLGAKPLAVVGFSIPVYQFIIGLQVGLGIATTASIANALGSNKTRYAQSLGTLVLLIGVITITVICTLLWFFQENIALYLGASPSLLQLLQSYWLPWLLSCWLGAMLYLGYSIYRSHGETILPGRVMVITSLLNILLDPLFIFTLEMGLAGAAWATCLSFCVGNYIIFKVILRKHYLAFLDDLDQIKKGITSIVKITIPAMLSQFIPPLSAMLVTIIIASYGEVAVGAWGLANRIEYLSIILILALTMALPPMVAKLRGMNVLPEIFQLIKTAVIFVISCQFIVMLILLFFAEAVATLLTNQAEVAYLLQNYMWIVPLSYGALGVCMVCISACNAMGLAKSALLISILRLFVCYLPLIWIGSESYGLLGIFIGATLGNLLSGVVGWFMFLKQYKELETPV